MADDTNGKRVEQIDFPDDLFDQASVLSKLIGDPDAPVGDVLREMAKAQRLIMLAIGAGMKQAAQQRLAVPNGPLVSPFRR